MGKTDIQLIAIDVDGTLVDALDAPVSERNRQAIRRAREKGIIVCLLSGRVYISLKSRAAEVGADGPLAACNGAYVRWKGRELFCRHIHRDALARCALLVQEAGVFFHVWTQQGGFCTAHNYDPQRYARMNASIPKLFQIGMQVYEDAADLAAQVGGSALKMTLLERDTRKLAALRPLLEKAAGPEAGVTSSEAFNLEVTDRRVNKGAALEVMARACGVPLSATMAIGNSYNDLPMLERAGLPIAVADAEETVLDAAKHVVCSCAGNGVAEAIEKYALGEG